MKKKKIMVEIWIGILLLSSCSLVFIDRVSADQEGDYTYTVNNGEATITDFTGSGGALTIPSTLGGYPTIAIGHHAFYSCTTLTSLTIPDSMILIGESAFSSCSSLRSVTIGNNVIRIEATAFSFCPLMSVTFGDKVTTIGDTAFASCTSLTSLTLPDSVTSIGNKAFHLCTSLSSIDIGTSVTTIGDQAFYHCSSLTTMMLPDSLIMIGDSTFSYCSSLSSVNMGLGLTTIGANAFSYCPLTAVTIPNNVITIGDSAFSYCSFLSNVTIGSNVKTIGNSAFYNCPLTTIIIPNNITTIGNYAFYSCSPLKTVTIGSNVKIIGTYAFASCSALTSISFLGLVAPTSVGLNWIKGAPEEIRGHAYAASNFPTPEQVELNFHGLKMGVVLQVENKLPQADFTWSPLNLTLNQTITFDALISSDPDGSLIFYEWDWNTDGVYEESHTTPTATHSWMHAGNYSVTLRVTDNRNATMTKTRIFSFIEHVDNEIDTTGTPGFELGFALCAIVAMLFLWKKKRRI
ncbi:MAG: leucine-rich repeat protein [Candidatus Thermoplasmatota archaeon]|nr:leucine-rich repeat protein [Candidatus Thermoplasmatota archaeon]